MRTDWLFCEPRADILAMVILLALSALCAWLTWGGFGVFGDQNWHAQVAARVATGEVLYRDVCWMYGPLPVYTWSLFYQLLGVNVVAFMLVHQVLAALACLLTYRVARFLLPVPLALLSTVALFLGRSGGGYASYVFTYGAISLGAVLGLLFVVCLLYYLKSKRAAWLVAAGTATGGAFLTKPEFALACVGTGLFFLGWIVLAPRPASFATHRGSGARALAIYAVSTAIVVGIGYGVLTTQAGWSHVWAGITGYGAAGWTVEVRPPWGTFVSWCYIASGLGIHLLFALVFVNILAPVANRKRVLLTCVLIGLGLALIVLPWVLMYFWPSRSFSIRAAFGDVPALIDTVTLLIWAPGTLLLSILGIILGIRWLMAGYRKRTIDQIEWSCAVLVVYSALAIAKHYFVPRLQVGLLSQYMDTLFPVFVFSLVVLVPRIMERRGQTGLRRSGATLLLAVVLLAYAADGLVSKVASRSLESLELVTPRGTVLMAPLADQPREIRLRFDALRYVISHTEPGDTIAVLEKLHSPSGFYFLSGCQNPLRQDAFYPLPGLGGSLADAAEIVQRIKTHQPGFILIPSWIENTGTSSGSERTTYEPALEWVPDLVSVWQYVRDHYQVRTVIGGEPWGYVIYEP